MENARCTDPFKLKYWQQRGVSDKVAVLAIKLLRCAPNPEQSFSFLSATEDRLSQHISEILKIRSLDDIEAIKTRVFHDGDNLESLYKTKCFATICFLENAEDKLSPKIRLNDFAASDDIVRCKIQDTAASELSAKEICARYGLSSLTVPVAPLSDGQYRQFLTKLDRDLSFVCEKFGYKDTQELGGFGRLNLTLTLGATASEGLRGQCTTFNRLQEGMINLPMSYHASSLIHEFTHWHDAKAFWAAGLNTENSRIATLSAHKEDLSNKSLVEWARKAISHVDEFKAHHPGYMKALNELDQAEGRLHSYLAKPEEILARASAHLATKDSLIEVYVLHAYQVPYNPNNLTSGYFKETSEPVRKWSKQNMPQWAKAHFNDMQAPEHKLGHDQAQLCIAKFASMVSMRPLSSKNNQAIGAKLS